MGARDFVAKLPLKLCQRCEWRKWLRNLRLSPLKSGKVGLDRVVLVELCLDIVVDGDELLRNCE